MRLCILLSVLQLLEATFSFAAIPQTANNPPPKEAVKSIQELCEETHHTGTRYQAISLLGQMGPAAASAVPTLLRMTNAHFSGIGMPLIDFGGRLIAQFPLHGTPAERAGIAPGDWIVAVDGKPTTRGRQAAETMRLIRESGRTKVTLTIRKRLTNPVQRVTHDYGPEINLELAKESIDDLQGQALAIQALGNIGPAARSALPRLKGIIAASDAKANDFLFSDERAKRVTLRPLALEAALKIAPPQSEDIKELIRWLKEGPGARALAARELEILAPDNQEALAGLISISKDPQIIVSEDNPLIRAAIERILQSHPGRDLSDGKATQSVTKHIDTGDLKGLITALKSPDQTVRENALTALADRKSLPPEALFAVRELAKRLTIVRKSDKEIDIWALPSYLRTTPLSIAIPEATFETGFLRALQRIATNNPDWTLEQLSAGDSDVTMAILRAFRRVGAPDIFLPGIIAVCGNQTLEDRKLAFDMLTPKVKDYPEMFPIALKALADPDLWLRKKASDTIRRYFEAPENLLPILKARNQYGGEAAPDLIVLIGWRRTIPILADVLLHDPDAIDRRQAAYLIAARCCGDEAKSLPENLRQQAVAALFTALRDPVEDVQGNALRSIASYAQDSPTLASTVERALRRNGLVADDGKVPAYATLNDRSPQRVARMVAALKGVHPN